MGHELGDEPAEIRVTTPVPPPHRRSAVLEPARRSADAHHGVDTAELRGMPHRDRAAHRESDRDDVAVALLPRVRDGCLQVENLGIPYRGTAAGVAMATEIEGEYGAVPGEPGDDPAGARMVAAAGEPVADHEHQVGSRLIRQVRRDDRYAVGGPQPEGPLGVHSCDGARPWWGGRTTPGILSAGRDHGNDASAQAADRVPSVFLIGTHCGPRKATTWTCSCSPMRRRPTCFPR